MASIEREDRYLGNGSSGRMYQHTGCVRSTRTQPRQKGDGSHVQKQRIDGAHIGILEVGNRMKEKEREERNEERDETNEWNELMDHPWQEEEEEENDEE